MGFLVMKIIIIILIIIKNKEKKNKNGKKKEKKSGGCKMRKGVYEWKTIFYFIRLNIYFVNQKKKIIKKKQVGCVAEKETGGIDE